MIKSVAIVGQCPKLKEYLLNRVKPEAEQSIQRETFLDKQVETLRKEREKMRRGHWEGMVAICKETGHLPADFVLTDAHHLHLSGPGNDIDEEVITVCDESHKRSGADALIAALLGQ